MNNAIKPLKTACSVLLFFTLLTGIVYPLLVTGLSQVIFPWQANGSLLNENGKNVGSRLIGQSFTGPEYFWGRPSATSPSAYNGEASSGSNLGPSNTEFLKTMKDRVTHMKNADPENIQPVPVDLVTGSGSGLDPEVSPLAAYYQVPRVAKARHINPSALNELIESHIKSRTFWILGEPRVNVLELNILLKNLGIQHGTGT